MADASTLNSSACRVKKCAFDLLSIANDIMDDDEGSWDLLERYLRLKSTFLFCDFNRMIAAAPRDQKKVLSELGNELFYSIEALDQAVKARNITLTQDRYGEAAAILQEVMACMP